MTFRELRAYLRQLRERGHEVHTWVLHLHAKLAFPLMTVVLAYADALSFGDQRVPAHGGDCAAGFGPRGVFRGSVDRTPKARSPHPPQPPMVALLGADPLAEFSLIAPPFQALPVQ